MKSVVSAYQAVQIDAAVLGATPYELISKLLSGAIDSVMDAKKDMQSGDIAGKSGHIEMAIAIISDGLRGSLDMAKGGELAQRLDGLYDYMLERLLKAHAENDVTVLDEVASLLQEIKSGWDGIKDQVSMS